MRPRDCPNRLFKYFGPERVDVLERTLIRYSPLSAFNDPFEGRPEIKDLLTHTNAAKLFTEILPKTIDENYELLPPEAKLVISLETFRATLMANFETRQDELFKQIQSFTPLLKSLLSQKFDEYIGALCLSEVPDSLLMWSHYAASHTGFVVEFDAHHNYFHEQRSSEDEFRHLRRVLYREKRPSAPLTELDATELFFVKSGHWAYEREWRILRALADATYTATAPCNSHPIKLFQFPQDTVTSVILGARILKDTEARIRNALHSLTNDKSPKLKRAIPDESHFFYVSRMKPSNPSVNQTREIVVFPSAWRRWRGLIT